MIALGITGALGRMGGTLVRLAAQDPAFRLAGVFERPGNPGLGRPLEAPGVALHPRPILRAASPETLEGLGVLIDFTEPAASAAHADHARKAGCALVIGTTGLSSPELRRIERASRSVAVVLSPNMSVGANLLFDLGARAASRLGPSYDIEIVEAHHRGKKDAPSGTARRLAEAVAEARGWALEASAVYGRKGMAGPRKAREIGIHAVRAGEIVGVHTVLFAGPGETVEITHRAASRDAFARGALLAARFAAGRRRGLYTMGDVIAASGRKAGAR